MNEKILEFAKQTGLCDEDGDFFGGKIGQYDEFAELIVRQCICLCDDENSQKYIAQKFGLAKELGLE